MKRIMILLLLFIFLTLTASINVIKMITSLMRHGARSPYYLDKTNKDIFGVQWTVNSAQLTQVGRRQLYLLGIKQKEDFPSFISEYYSSSEITGFSSNKPRAIESLESFFHGLFNKQTNLSDKQIERAFPPIHYSTSINNIARSIAYPLPENSVSATFVQMNPTTDKYYFVTDCKCFPNYTEERNAEIDRNIIKFGLKWRFYLEKGFGLYINFNNPGLSRVALWNLADTYIMNYLNGNDLTDKIPFLYQKIFYNDLQVFFTDDMLKGTYCDANNGFYLARAAKTKFFQDLFKMFDRRIILNSEEYTPLDPKMTTYFLHDHDLIQLMVIFNKLFKQEFNTPIVPSSFANFILSYDEVRKEYFIEVMINDINYISMNYVDFKQAVESIYIPLKEIDNFCGFEEK